LTIFHHRGDPYPKKWSKFFSSIHFNMGTI
jgi:hypothetical protein